MIQPAEWLLIIAAGTVGVLHTMVPDHWAPIALLARQKGWSRKQAARAALGAGTGHVLSTLLLGLIVWGAGVALVAKYGHWIEIISRVALIGFGLWIAFGGWREMTAERAHEHAHSHGHRPQPGPGIGFDVAELPFNARTDQKRRGIAKRPECDDDKARFEAKLGELAKVKSPKK